MVILALDDEKMALESIVDELKEVIPDAEVHAFASAMDALDFAASTPVHVAFLDIDMPVMNGIEVAKRLKKFYSRVNIVFTTAYSSFALEALRLHSSGYLMKPIRVEDLQTELEQLRNPVNRRSQNSGIYAKTFGSFELFMDGRPVHIANSRSREILAYLIDRQGSTVTRKEIAGIIFEDASYTRSTQTMLTRAIDNLQGALQAYNIEGLLIREHNAYSVNMQMLRCDAYDYLHGDPEAMNLFNGEYMSQYSWAEGSFAQFYS